MVSCTRRCFFPCDIRILANPLAPCTAPFTKRSTVGVLRTDHEGAIDGTAAEADETIAFSSTTCTVLNPEGEVGPFYVLGEYVQSDLVQDEEGVSVVADIQFIDVTTCEPLSGVCKYRNPWASSIAAIFTGCVSVYHKPSLGVHTGATV